MTDAPTMTRAEIEDLAFRALVAAGTAEANARPAFSGASAIEPPANESGSMRPSARSASVTVGSVPPWS